MIVGRAVRWLLVFGMAAVPVLFLGTGTAAAHAVLLGADPAALATVPTQPGRLTLTFSEAIEVGADPIVVTGPDGRPVELHDVGRNPADATELIATPPTDGSTGTYAVTWRVTALDGHPIHGSYRFAVGAPDTDLSGIDSGEQAGGERAGGEQAGTGPSVLGGAGRALATTGVLALLGLAAFGALVLGPVRRRLDPQGLRALPADGDARLRPAMIISAVLAVVGTCAVLTDTAADASGLSPLAVLARPGVVVGQALGTGTGGLLALRSAVLVGLIVLLAARPGGSGAAGRRNGVVALVSLALLPTFSLASHAVAVREDRPVAVALDGLHLAASGIWAGGLLALALIGGAVAPPGRRGDPGVIADVVGRLTGRFSTVAQLCMLTVLVTGTYAVVIRVDAVSDLVSTSWGVALTVKIALWLTLLALAAANAVTLLPRVSRRVGQVSRRAAASGELAGAIRVELALGAALLAVGAVLAATSPPAEARLIAAADVVPVPAVARSFVGSAEDYTLEVRVRRVGAGPTAGTVISIGLSRQGTPIPASQADVEVVAPDGAPRRIAVHEVDEGGWESNPLVLSQGSYQLTGRFTRSAGTVVVPVPISVPG